MGLIVAGFGGRPIASGAGLKPVLVRDPETDRFAIFHGGQPGVWWSQEEVAQHEANALLTRVPSPAGYCDNAVALYAHQDFVAPPQEAPELDEDGPLIVLQPAGLRLEKGCRSYVGFFSEEDALETLDHWAQTLLQAAQKALERQGKSHVVAAGGTSTAFREALRARYALAGRSDPESRARRWEACVLAWASVLLQGGNPAALRSDAALEHTDRELLDLEREAACRFHAASGRQIAVRRGYRDQTGAVHRRLEDAA